MTYWLDEVHVQSVAELADPGGDLVEHDPLFSPICSAS